MSNDNGRNDAAVQVIASVAEIIRTLGKVPSGELYAQVMGHMSVNTYLHIIEILVRAGLVKQEHFVLYWIGPNTPTEDQK